MDLDNMSQSERLDAIDAELAGLTLAQLTTAALFAQDRAAFLIGQAAEIMARADSIPDEGVKVEAIIDAGGYLHGARAYAASADLMRRLIDRRTAR